MREGGKGEESRASEKEGKKRKQKFIFIQFTCYMSEQIMVVTNFLLNYCIRKGEMKKWKKVLKASREGGAVAWILRQHPSSDGSLAKGQTSTTVAEVERGI
jgi:hypothetical protein